MGSWLSFFLMKEECEGCHGIDEAPSCKETADFVQDFAYEDQSLKESIRGLLDAKLDLQKNDEVIAELRDNQAKVDATRQNLLVNDYRKPGTFIVRSGEHCMTNGSTSGHVRHRTRNGGGSKVSFYKCNMDRRQLWKTNAQGKTVSVHDGLCFDKEMNMVPCDSTRRGRLHSSINDRRRGERSVAKSQRIKARHAPRSSQGMELRESALLSTHSHVF